MILMVLIFSTSFTNTIKYILKNYSDPENNLDQAKKKPTSIPM